MVVGKDTNLIFRQHIFNIDGSVNILNFKRLNILI